MFRINTFATDFMHESEKKSLQISLKRCAYVIDHFKHLISKIILAPFFQNIKKNSSRNSKNKLSSFKSWKLRVYDAKKGKQN